MGSENLGSLLKDLTGQQEMWEGFHPSDAASSQTKTTSSAMSGGINNPDDSYDSPGDGEDDGYETCGSADMIHGTHSLTIEEYGQTYEEPRNYNLNKARQFISDEPGFVRRATKGEKVNWEKTGLKVGEASKPDTKFTPWTLVVDYLGRFTGKTSAGLASSYFTVEALLGNQLWDFFYLHYPPAYIKNPVFFVPTYQFEHHLKVVNAELDLKLAIPGGSLGDNLKLAFGHDGVPRPRFMGRSTSHDHFEELSDAVPKRNPADKMNKTAIDNFLGTMNAIGQAGHGQKKNKSEKTRKKRAEAHRDWGHSIKRVQRYLGLRKKSAAAEKAKPSLDLSMSMAEEMERSVVFIAIDLEAYEHENNKLTEIGVAILDTAKISNVAPGEGGKKWFDFIDAHHIRVKENAWMRNSTYLAGCPDRFDFGESDVVLLDECAATLDKIINESAIGRPVVLVFHEASSDIRYLNLIGYDINIVPNFVEVVDTREMEQFINRSSNAAKLKSLLDWLDIDSRNLHNAGNDAVYTLQAMISLAIKKRVMSLEKLTEKTSSQKISGHVPFGEFKKKEQQGEGWSSGGEDTDGGEPISRHFGESNNP
ncbi:hypothetical protein B0H67DRAFT_646498 [Lasiosphaeris hirsuta]|uniref:Gfd2/YDR514C-like C-terminal domain-containing protein n=1 Tax=Lasiosphaeris hirsuta TaxID=260670 RepID=A0AA40A8D5_9PEZI|nr:hypothetical protein B0H67DRAFT_646498 [Lasiosphaeris hirsuta]